MPRAGGERAGGNRGSREGARSGGGGRRDAGRSGGGGRAGGGGVRGRAPSQGGARGRGAGSRPGTARPAGERRPTPTRPAPQRPRPTAEARPAVSERYKEIAKQGRELGFHVTSTKGGEHNSGSLHARGRAVDFSVRGKTDAEVRTLIDAMRTAGFRVRDERKRPAGQKVWTGPHIHVSK